MSKKEKPDSSIGGAFKETSELQMSEWEVVKRLWQFMRPYWSLFAISLVLLPIITGLTLVQPWLLQLAIDNHFVPKDLNGFGLVVGGYAAAMFSVAALQFLQTWIMQLAGQRALRDLRQALFEHVQHLSTKFFQSQPVGRLMARMTTDIESLQEALASGMITMVGDVMMLVGIVVILLIKDWQFALASFVVVPFLVGLTAVFRHFMRKAFREIRVKVARLYSYLQESVTGISVIQLFVREKRGLEEYQRINEEYRNANFMAIRYDAMLYSVVETVGSITVGVIIWYGSGQVLQDAISLGVLVAFIEYMQKFFVPIRDLAQKYNFLQSAITAGERIFELLDQTDKIPQPESTRDVPKHVDSIEFKNVSFAYKTDEWVLRDVSFKVERGEKVALVGHTGAGKSTIITLLTRLRDVTEGAILINGIDIREFDVQEYRHKFAVVLQDCFLFQGSVLENITLGDEIPMDEVERATQAVHAWKLIQAYPEKFQQSVQERGANLSAGERQLISFARALVHKPEVLILDEATANVDTQTESLLQSAVENMLERQTSVVVAHRLSTIQKADTILVLHRGELIERGSHAELLASDGHYAKLHRLQYRPSAQAKAS